MEEYHLLKKYKNKNKLVNESSSLKKVILGFINQILICVVLFLVALILTKNTSFKDKLYEFIYSYNFSFLEIEEFFKKHFGSIIPSISEEKDTQIVSSEKLEYKKLTEIENGVLLEVDKGQVITSLESGLVVFNGEKENYGKVLILEQVDGVEAWYIGITLDEFNLYDYIEKGTIIGESSNTEIKLLFKKNKEGADYKTYLF